MMTRSNSGRSPSAEEPESLHESSRGATERELENTSLLNELPVR